MAVNDQISDMFVRIRNAANAGFSEVVIPHSKIKESVLKIICDEGFLNDFELVGESYKKNLVVQMKYSTDKKPIFNEIRRISKLGKRVYLGANEIRSNRQGVGVTILSTSKGVMKDIDAKRQGVGGEVICTIW